MSIILVYIRLNPQSNTNFKNQLTSFARILKFLLLYRLLIEEK